MNHSIGMNGMTCTVTECETKNTSGDELSKWDQQKNILGDVGSWSHSLTIGWIATLKALPWQSLNKQEIQYPKQPNIKQ